MPPKRKRAERNDSGPSRPSPHRPADTSLGRHDGGYEGGGRGRGGRSSRRNDRRDSSQSFTTNPQSSAPAPGPISPTLARPSSSSSSAPPPTVNMQVVPTPALPSPPPPPLQPGYHYAIITDEQVERWKQGARQEIIDHGVQSRNDEDLMEVTTIFQELFHSVADGRLQGVDAGGVVRDILGPEPSEADRMAAVFDSHTLFLDTVATLLEIESAPYQPELGEFMRATGVSPGLMRLVLDFDILRAIDLVRESFFRMGVRQSTNLLYRQANYNLLREETEGFSKVITELFTTSSAEPPSSEVVQATFNRVMGLIGTFDLHPGRVLDVTLDVFAAVLIKQFRFFIKFLRVSSWWPRSLPRDLTSLGVGVGGLPVWALPEHFNWFASEEEEAELAAERVKRDIAFWIRAREIKLGAFFELGGRQLTTADEQRLAISAVEDGQEASIEQEWVRLTKTAPPTGNRDAAQMLGFKLRFYTSEARDAEDVLPANLLYLISLLIKVGFISLTDLWNHVWPRDEEMEALRVKKMKELEEKEAATRHGGAQNALMKAGALPDDMPPPPTTTRRDPGPGKVEADAKPAEAAEEKPKLPEPDEQKGNLLKCLLTIGAIPESLFIMGRHDWMLEAFPDLLPLIYRILHHALDVVFHQSRPVASHVSETPPKKLPDLDQSGVPKGTIKLSAPPTRRALRWPFPDKADTSEGSGYRFYWDEWADNIPVCQTVDDVFTLCDTFLNVAGVNIGQDAALMAKLTSISAKSLADDQSPENKSRWLALLKRLLVPALSLSDANASLVETVWTLLKQYPIQVRYNVYAEWYEGSVSRLEPIKKAFAQTRLKTLANMKRLSLTNIPQMAKSLAKIAYASPGILCKVALLQIESYSNLIDAFVECVKYFTDLGYDVLVWAVLSSIGGQRNRTQEDSVLLTSKWLQALSKFSGKVFQRYNNMNPVPILRYVNDQLVKGNSTDLLILRELIEQMGGVVSDIDFTDSQLRAMTGGEVLRRETLISLGDRRSISVRSSDRLIKSLVDTKLAGRLLINIAQYRQNAIYRAQDGDAHNKYLSAVVDDTHQILLQYLDLLRSSIDRGTFNSLVPGIIQLMGDFGLDTGLAFLIGRASIRLDMAAAKALKDSQAATQSSRATTDPDGDVAMEPANDGIDPKPESPVNSRKADPLLDALQPLIDEIPTVLPDRSWRHLSAVGYVFFWSLQLGDLSFPQESYEAESSKMKKQAEDVMKDRSDMTRPGMNKKTQKRKDILDRQGLLLKENTLEIQRYSKTRLQISKHLAAWFPTEIAKADVTSDALLEQCILPRLELSPLDAEYCFRLIKFLHDFSAPNFKLMSLYDRLFNHNRLRGIIFKATVREAEHLGRFLRCVLGDLSRWHTDKGVYEKEALGMKEIQGKKTRNFLGFSTAMDSDGKPTAFVEHDAYREHLFRWHKELNSALRACLNDTEWMHVRNAITVLKSIIDYFPAINFMAEKFLEQLKTIAEREAAPKNASESEQGHRVDLSVTAQTTFSELQRRKTKWILVQTFRPGPATDSRDDQRNSAAHPTSSALRASAPDFKPSSTSRKQTTAEEEDGEVKDSKGAKITNGSSETRPSAQPKHPLPTREAPKDHAADAAQRTSSTATPSGKPGTPKPATPSSTPAPSGRPEPPRFSTLPPGGHGLPSRPELPNRPDVPFPSTRFGPPRHGGREAPPRESRDYRETREPRDARDARDPRGPHDSRDLRDPRDARDSRDPREVREPREPRESRDTREPREAHPRENRDAASGREARDYRPPDNPRPDRPREFAPPDRRPAEAASRDAVVRPERDWPNRAEPPGRRSEPAPPPDREPRPSRDRTSHGPGRVDSRASREHPAPPPAVTPVADAQEPLVNPDRLRHFADADRPDIINPARAALIGDNRDPPRSNSSSRDQPRERPSRTDSPRRSDHQTSGPPHPDKVRDDRPSRQRHSDFHSSRDAHGESTVVPSRMDRTAEREPERTQSFKDSTFNSQSGRGADMDQGRASQQDPNYGRLNTIPSVVDLQQGPPSGPRGRGRNNARGNNMPGPPMRTDHRYPNLDPIRPPSPERQPPTGPSSSRPRRSQYDSNSNVNSPTSAGPSSGSAVHPDRVRQIHQQPPSGPSSSSGPPPPPLPPPPSAVHPDRMNQIGGPGAQGPRPPIHTPDRPSAPALNTGARPSPLATEFSTPTGPAATSDRMRPGGSRQLRGIQNTLEKASADNGRGPGSFRQSRRPNLVDSDAKILAGSSPVTTPIHERPDPIRDSFRQDGGPDRAPRGPEPIQVVGDSRDGRSGRNGDEHGASRGEHDRGSRRDHHRSDRSNRPSRRSSRERSPEREREGKDGREYRERKTEPSGGASSSNRESERDPTGSRRSIRESGGGRDSLPGGRDAGHPRDSNHRSHRTDAPSGPRGDMMPSGRSEGHGGRSDSMGGRAGEDYGNGGRSGSSRGNGVSRDSRPRMGDDRGDSRSDARGDDRGRKRRSEGLGDAPGSHQDKRPRR